MNNDNACFLASVTYWIIEAVIYAGTAVIAYHIHPHFWGILVAVVWGLFIKFCCQRAAAARVAYLHEKMEDEFSKERFGEWKVRNHGTVCVKPREGESIEEAIERVAKKIQEALEDEESKAVTEEKE